MSTDAYSDDQTTKEASVPSASTVLPLWGLTELHILWALCLSPIRTRKHENFFWFAQKAMAGVKWSKCNRAKGKSVLRTSKTLSQACCEHSLEQGATALFWTKSFCYKKFCYICFSLTWLVWESGLKIMVSISFIRYPSQTFAIV